MKKTNKYKVTIKNSNSLCFCRNKNTIAVTQSKTYKECQNCGSIQVFSEEPIDIRELVGLNANECKYTVQIITYINLAWNKNVDAFIELYQAAFLAKRYFIEFLKIIPTGNVAIAVYQLIKHCSLPLEDGIEILKKNPIGDVDWAIFLLYSDHNIPQSEADEILRLAKEKENES